MGVRTDLLDREDVGVVLMENNKDMPIGLAFQMSMNERALENFGRMTDAEKRQVLEAARGVTSKEQMRGIVEDIGRLN